MSHARPSRRSRSFAPDFARTARLAAFAAVVLLLVALPVRAQDDPATTQPAFSLSSEQIFEPGAQTPPTVHLTFRRLGHLDFRVYKVGDTAKFFSGLARGRTCSAAPSTRSRRSRR